MTGKEPDEFWGVAPGALQPSAAAKVSTTLESPTEPPYLVKYKSRNIHVEGPAGVVERIIQTDGFTALMGNISLMVVYLITFGGACYVFLHAPTGLEKDIAFVPLIIFALILDGFKAFN